MARRASSIFVQEILAESNSGQLDATSSRPAPEYQSGPALPASASRPPAASHVTFLWWPMNWLGSLTSAALVLRWPRTHSQFQRAFTALGVAHCVAADAPSQRQIERRLATFQNRLLSLLAYKKSRVWNHYPSPNLCFWVTPHPRNPKDPVWPNVLAHHSLSQPFPMFGECCQLATFFSWCARQGALTSWLKSNAHPARGSASRTARVSVARPNPKEAVGKTLA